MKTNELIQAYLLKCKNIKKLEPLTLKAYTIDLGQFSAYLSENHLLNSDINEIDKPVLVNYIDRISGQYAPKSLKRKIASLKAFFNFLEFENIIEVTPLRKIKLTIKEPKRLPKSLTIFDIERILRALYQRKNSNSIASIRNIAVFEMLFVTGLRVSELCNLKMNDFNLDTQVLSIKGKGNKERLLYINNQDTLAALKNYFECRQNNNEYIFINRIGNRLSEQSVRYLIEGLGKRALDRYVTPHMIRHSFATLMIEEGVDVTYVQAFLE